MSNKNRPAQARPDGHVGELEACQADLAELRLAHQRLGADLVNLRERHRRDFAQAVGREAQSLIRDWLGVVDDLERALEASVGAPEGTLRDGLEAVVREARHQLQQRGLERFDSLGAAFDPFRHEAVGTSEEGEAGCVHAEVRPGYMLGGAVLRPAEVIVGKGQDR